MLNALLVQMPIWDHLEELRERVLVGALAAGIAVLTCFAFSKDLVVFLEAPVASQGVRFLQLSPGEFFFTTLKVGRWVVHNDCSCDGQSKGATPQ
jgi:sec-independent protein translocase protein TatC